MCVSVKQPKLTAGHDNNVEVVLLHTVPMIRQGGTLYKYDDAKSFVRTAFYAQYCKEVNLNPQMSVVFSAMSVEKKDRYVQWLICNYGGENEQPDYNVETGVFYKEYWDCGQKDTCPGFGVVCRNDLTPREYSVLKLFYSGVPDKLIADDLHITENTVRSHRRNLFSKLNAHNKQEAIRQASKESIIL